MSRNDPLRGVSTRQTSQSQPASPKQVRNSAGGYTFQVPPITRLRRFLMLGSDGGTYYTNEQPLTHSNARVVLEYAQHDPITLVNEVIDVSINGRAPRQQPAIFALAAAAASMGGEDSEAGRRAAVAAIPQVCRTGFTLFVFANYVEQFRGWGKLLRRGVTSWYLNREVAELTYQVLKYRQREGWTHRDLLRLSHPETTEHARRALFDWITSQHKEMPYHIPETRQVIGFQRAQSEQDPQVIANLITEYRLSWEMLPDHALKRQEVWEALLSSNSLPLGALIRQLPRLTNLGMLHPTKEFTQEVCRRLTNFPALKHARIHPVSVLIALKTYASGHSPNPRSRLTWNPSRPVIDALDSAFYKAFRSAEPTGKRIRLALDVSGSMNSPISGINNLSCREASAAMSLAVANMESTYDIVGFCSSGTPIVPGDYYGRSRARAFGGYAGADLNNRGISYLSLSPRQRLDDAVRSIDQLPFGGTDCALPIMHALQHKLEFDAFVVFTDNETWAGSIHPHQALRKYKEQMGIDAKLIVVGMTATDFSIADPDDPNMLDVAGFDSNVPTLINDFIGGGNSNNSNE